MSACSMAYGRTLECPPPPISNKNAIQTQIQTTILVTKRNKNFKKSSAHDQLIPVQCEKTFLMLRSIKIRLRNLLPEENVESSMLLFY